MASQMSKKRKFVADGVFFAELNEGARGGWLFWCGGQGYARADRDHHPSDPHPERRRKDSTPENGVDLYSEKVSNRGLCAIAQAESLRDKLLGGLAVRTACYGVLRFVMESGAKGCEVIVSGKLRAQPAKSMKFKDGYMVSSG
ncbi:unnamed protein product [Musa hybrid cultivar]